MYYGPVHMEEDRGAAALQLERAAYGNLRALLTATLSSSYPSAVLTSALLPGSRWKWAIQTCSALTHLHSHSVIHRDLFCRNVLLTTKSRPKTLRFRRFCDSQHGQLRPRNRLVMPVPYICRDKMAMHSFQLEQIFLHSAPSSMGYSLVTPRTLMSLQLT